MCSLLCMHVCMTCVCTCHDMILFSPSTFMWALGIKLRLSSFRGKHVSLVLDSKVCVLAGCLDTVFSVSSALRQCTAFPSFGNFNSLRRAGALRSLRDTRC